MNRGFALLLLICTVAILSAHVAPVMAQTETCYTAGGQNPGSPPAMTFSAIFVLSADETQVSYTVNCCGCVPQNTFLVVSVASLGFQTNLAGLSGKTCPFSGVWKSTDPTPLTPALVTALKNGTMGLLVYKPICTPAATQRFLVLDPCDQ